MLSPKIETDRLILRRYKETDIDEIYEIITDNRLSTFIKYPDLTKKQELECIKDWIKEADESIFEKWVIERKIDGAIVGNIEVNKVIKKHNYCTVGYAIRYDYWGNGYAAEALEAVSNHLLEESGYHLVECSCNELNKQSSRVMEKAGFKKDGYIANRRLNKDGTYSGVNYYSKSKDKISYEKITLVPYTDNDYEFVYNVKKNAYKKYVEECWGSWIEEDQRKHYEKFINNVKNNTFIIMYGEKKIGFYNGEILPNGNYEVGNICIIPEYQGKGIGTQILKNKLEENKDRDIEIQYFKQNPVGRLYEKLGFIPNGETEFHYRMKMAKKNK